MSAAPNAPISAAVLEDLFHAGPLVLIGVWSLLLVMADAFTQEGLSRRFQQRLALFGAALAGLWTWTMLGDPAYDGGRPIFFGLLIVDHFSLLVDLALIAVAALVCAFAGDFARSQRFEYGEQEALIFISTFGMMTLAHAGDFLTFFLGLETMSLPIYVLVAARLNSRGSPEAALKYFLMGALSSALLVMGIALMYGALGTTSFERIPLRISQVFTEWGAAQDYVRVLDQGTLPPGALASARDNAVVRIAPAMLLLPGMLLVLAALLFKVSAVPLHMWTPDAYEGAPTPVTAFMASGVKLGAFALMIRLFVGVLNTNRLVTEPYGWTSVLALIAFLTMTVGNLAAARQVNVKRLLAYSSVAHVGYLLVGVVAAGNFYGQIATGLVRKADQTAWAHSAGDAAVSGLLFYLITYSVATIGAFAAVSWLVDGKREATHAHDWSGLAQRHPGVALGVTFALLSLMGLPPFAGFFGKVFVFRAALENDNAVLRYLVIAAMLNSVIGAYYYLRLIVNMYFRPEPREPIEPDPLHGQNARAVVALTALLSLTFGVGAHLLAERCDLAAAGFGRAVVGAPKAAAVKAHRERGGATAAPAADAPPAVAQGEGDAAPAEGTIVDQDPAAAAVADIAQGG
jgi:NADH-quinone oxidoreductase subunit N